MNIPFIMTSLNVKTNVVYWGFVLLYFKIYCCNFNIYKR